MGEFILIEKIFLESHKLKPNDDMFLTTFYKALKDQTLMEIYFTIIPDNYNWEEFGEVFVIGLEGLEIDKIGIILAQY